MIDRAVVVVNPVAGGGQSVKSLPAVEQALNELSVTYRVEITSGLEHAAELAGTAGSNGELVVAVGGDGLIGCLAGALKPYRGCLAVVPSGRGNDLARLLNIPKDPYEATVMAVQGSEKTIDLAEANGKPFLSVASYGFDSEANRIANETKLPLGRAVYLYGAAKAIAGWEPARFTVGLDGTERSFLGYSVAVGNSKVYGGGMYVAPDAQLDDGLLDVVMIKDQPKHRFVTDMRKVFSGTHTELPAVEVVRAKTVDLDADRTFQVYADGDPIGETPLQIKVIPEAVRIVVPNSEKTN